MRALIPYVIATISVAGVAIAQQPSFTTPTSSPEQPTIQSNEAPAASPLTFPSPSPTTSKSPSAIASPLAS
ncbi:hypothetical protein U2F10_25420 [Leptothoe sp. EHU-05/26/07-4]|uniref:hypothetical protein n=1 Tax=Adonisia turfae TaxID=2950184 RepID=UPI0013D71941|nr:hypothetical protein [Adonisia turfae]